MRLPGAVHSSVPRGETPPRSLRIGTRISLIGLVLLALFGGTVAATGLATGAPSEASFVAFGLGFLLTVIGHATLAAGLRRAGILHRLWIAPLVAAVGALIALVAPDIWHDLGLLTLTAAWTTLGRPAARTDAPRPRSTPIQQPFNRHHMTPSAHHRPRQLARPTDLQQDAGPP